jgi:hypothetical protein
MVDRKIAIGAAVAVGVLMLTPGVAAAVGRALKPLGRAAVRAGAYAYDEFRRAGAEAYEHLEDVAAEFRAEADARAEAAAGAAAAAATEAPGGSDAAPPRGQRKTTGGR